MPDSTITALPIAPVTASPPRLDELEHALRHNTRLAALTVNEHMLALNRSGLLEPGEMQEVGAIVHALELAVGRIADRYRTIGDELDAYERDTAVNEATTSVFHAFAKVLGPRPSVDETDSGVNDSLVTELRRTLHLLALDYSQLPDPERTP